MKTYEIIIWVAGHTTGHIFRNQTSEALGRVIRCVNGGDPFSLNFRPDQTMMYSANKISHFQFTEEK